MKFSRQKIGMAIFFGVALVGGVVALRMRHGAHETMQHAAHKKGTYYCPMHPSYTSDRSGDCPICGMRLVKRQEEQPLESHAKDLCVMHNCPMVHGGRPCPMQVVAKAGEKVVCPICGTHMSGKEGTFVSAAENPVGYAALQVSAQKQQRIGIKTAPVVRRSLRKTIRTVGRIAYDPELYQAQQEYLLALDALKNASSTASAQILEQSRQLVEATRMRLRLLGLGEGFIKGMDGWQGPDKGLLLADPGGHVWLYAPIYEFELPIVQVGQEVLIEIPASAGRTIKGVIRSIDPVLDPQTRSARARVMVEDPQGFLRPEMYVDASIAVDLGEVIAVPREAVMDTGARQLLFVVKGEGTFEPRRVTVGAKGDDFIEIASGVAEGEQVVVAGNFLIDSESRLQAALEEMPAGEHHAH